MKILVACEESQAVTKELRRLGHDAYSCDILECSGGHPEWHIQGDVLPLLNPDVHTLHDCQYYGFHFQTMDGVKHRIRGKWDMIIAFPPCTYLTVTGNRYFDIEKYGEKAIQRHKDREAAIGFFLSIANADCEKIAIENPVGVMSSRWRRPDQIIHPYMFGDAFEKRTCLWLKALPCLRPTNVVEVPVRQMLPSGKTMPAWYSKKYSRYNPDGESRQSMRSKTFPGIAKAMAEQWVGKQKQEGGK